MNTFGLATKSWWPPDDAAAKEFYQYADKYNKDLCLKHYDLVTTSANSMEVSNSAGSTLADFLRRRIEGRVPTSLIRLGDGEGNVLFAGLNDFPNLSTYILQKISTIWYGSKFIVERDLQSFLSALLNSIEHADVIGGPELNTIKNSFLTADPELDVRGMCGMRGVYNYLATSFPSTSLSKTIWASTWFSRALLPHYFTLLHKLPFLGLITCYPELGGALKARAAIGEVQTTLVPKQASISKKHHDILHYPELYQKILNSIRPPYEGAVYIVAAGVLSKPYCTMIKNRGGIAIDVGSVADIWMGTESRPNMPANIVDRWKIL